MTRFLVEPAEIDALAADAVVLDCSWFAPEAGRRGLDAFREEHIPGALFFDLDQASDPASPYPNMMPSPEHFAEVAGSLGIDEATEVVVYDRSYVSARVWWMFWRFGHRRAAILDGGLRRWKAEGRPLESGEPAQVPPKAFRPDTPGDDIARWQDVAAALATGSAQVVDARPADRFTGALPSGYPGLASGHMPGAVNLPWTAMMRAGGDFRFIEPADAERTFRQAGIDPDRPVIATCGSGVTAAVLAFQLLRTGRPGWKIYDGSWNEWARRGDLPRDSLT